MANNTRIPLAAKGERPYFLSSPDIEKVLNVTLALAGEVSVAYSRLRVLERVIENAGLCKPGAVDAYKLSDEDARALDEWRSTFLKSVLRPIHAEIAGASSQQETIQPYDQAIKLAENSGTASRT
jgi:hypothetical protein